MKQKDNLIEAKIRICVKKYLDEKVENGEISKFCGTLSEKLIMKYVELELMQYPFKSNGLMQMKTNNQTL